MDNIQPYGYSLFAAKTTNNYIRIGGTTSSTSNSDYFGGYIYDFRINLAEAILPCFPNLTSANLATDIFRLSRNNIVADVSPQLYDTYRNGASFMAKFSPKAQTLNNIQLKDNIFIAGIGEGIALRNTKLMNSIISGNYVLSSLYQNYKFHNLDLTNTIIRDNYATSPRLDNIESLFISNCSATDSSVIGGVYTFNSAATGTIVTGINKITVSNVGCLCCLDDCVVLDSFNYLVDNTLLTNITSISAFGAGIKIIDQTYSLPHINTYNFTKINLNSAFLSSNKIGIEAYNVGGSMSNIYAPDNTKGLYCSLGNNNTYINNFTALQTRNISTVCLQIIDNNKKGVLYMNNCLLTSTTSRPHSSLVLDNDFALLNISNTNISVTAFSSVFAPDKPLRGYYEFNNCNFAVSAITALSAFVVPDSLRNLGLTHTNYNNVTGNYITYISNNRISSDSSTSIENITQIPSERVTPNHRTRKAKSSSKFVAIGPETASATISVQVHTSFVLESDAYNGTSPRLILKANPNATINEDVILDILPLNTSTRGNFITLSAPIPPVLSDTIYEFYVDCDGTVGWINVDNWQAT